jgi:hypothetical protein
MKTKIYIMMVNNIKNKINNNISIINYYNPLNHVYNQAVIKKVLD